jgi:hypothetical protein
MTASLNYQSIQPTLTNVQTEMLKVFALQLPEQQLNELRLVIARFLMDKARSEATTIWEDKGYTEETLNKLTEGTYE